MALESVGKSLLTVKRDTCTRHTTEPRHWNKQRFLPGLQNRRAVSALTSRKFEKNNTFLKLPPQERAIVSGIRRTLEKSIDTDLRMGVINIQIPTPRPKSELKSMLPQLWPPEGFRSVGIHDRVKSAHGRYSGNITDAFLCTCDRTVRGRGNLLSAQFCDILGPYSCADCTRKRRFIRLHEVVIPAEMDENAFTPLARLEREAAMREKKLLDRRRNIASAGSEWTLLERNSVENNLEEKDEVAELPAGLLQAKLQKRRGTVEMMRSLVKYTRYSSAFPTYQGDVTKVGPPLARAGAFKESSG